MSFSLADYPSPAQERDARIHDIDLDAVECPCGAQHPGAYKLSVCEQKLCETRGCHECLHKCQLHNAGMFCELHLNDVGGMAACIQCERMDLEDEDFIEHVARVA